MIIIKTAAFMGSLYIIFFLIKLLIKENHDLPRKISTAYRIVAAMTVISSVMLTFHVRNLVYVCPLLVICVVGAYTDYHTRKLYDVVSAGGLIIGIILLAVLNTVRLHEFIPIVGVLVILYAAGCMKSGDILLLAANYPYIRCICGADEASAFLLYLLVIVAALILSIICSIPKMFREGKLDWSYGTCYAPYHLAAVWIFLLITA